MSSHVYVLQHAHRHWIKIGKADVLLTRCKLLGLSRLDLRASFAVEVGDPNQALRLESILHRLFARSRIPGDQVLAHDGMAEGSTEWFDAACRTPLEQILDSIRELIPQRRIEAGEFQVQVWQLINDAAAAARLRQRAQQQKRWETEKRAAQRRLEHEQRRQALVVEDARVQFQLRSLQPVFDSLTSGLSQCYLIRPALRPLPGAVSCDAGGRLQCKRSTYGSRCGPLISAQHRWMCLSSSLRSTHGTPRPAFVCAAVRKRRPCTQRQRNLCTPGYLLG